MQVLSNSFYGPFGKVFATIAPLALASGAWLASADAPALAYDPAIQIIQGSTPSGEPLPRTPPFTDLRSVGYQFNTTIDRVIDGIGVYDHENDGLVQFHKVGVWQKNWQGDFVLFGQYSFGPGSGATCNPQSFWCWIPVPLKEFKTGDYMITATWEGNVTPFDPLAYNTPPPGPGVSYKPIGNQLNYLFPVRSGSLTSLDVDYDTDVDAYPIERVDQDAGGYFSATVSFYTATNKTPAPLPLFGAAAVFGWSRKLRSRVQQSQ